MSSKRSKKKHQKQLAEKQVEKEKQTEQTDVSETEAVDENIDEVTVCETAEDVTDKSVDETVAETENDIVDDVTDSEQEDSQINDLQQVENEDFVVMMQDFKAAVEHINEKDPDEETLIRLFGECDTDSLKEKVIEHPYEIIEKEPLNISKIVMHFLYVASALLFVGVLAVFGVISFFDEDKLVSQSENRALAQRPELTLTSIFDGKYTVEFENYYTDNFPARDFFISVNGKIKNIMTRFSVGENSDVIISVDKSDNDFAGEGVDLDNNAEDTDVMKENTAEVTPEEEATIKGSILISDKRAMEIYTYKESDAKRYTSIINKVSASLPEGVKFYSLVAPTSVEFYGTKTYREGIYSQREAVKKIYSMLNKNVITVDAYSALVDKSDEYIYFRTDHHWTARGAYYAYTAFCKSAGMTAPEIDSFITHNIEGFVGSLYRSSQADVLKNNPDYVECFELLVDATNTVYTTPEMTDGVNTYIVAKKVSGDNKYLAFISGDQPIEKIKTNVANGKKILVLKESFGNAFVPFLCNNYEEIYVVDPRKADLYLPDFVEKNSIGEVLAINYCFGISNSKYCKEMEKLVVKEAE